MTPSNVKFLYERRQQVGYFFTRKSMKFFGDTMANFGCRDAGEYWELYRKKPVKYKLQTSHYFHKVTFDECSEGVYKLRTETK